MSCSEDKTFRLWDGQTFKCRHVTCAHRSYVTCCDFSEGRDLVIITGGGDKQVRIWSLDESNKSYEMSIDEIDDDSHVPQEYLCPITHEIMKNPVKASGNAWSTHVICMSTHTHNDEIFDVATMVIK